MSAESKVVPLAPKTNGASVLMGLNEAPIQTKGEEGEAKVMELGDAIQVALLATIQGDRPDHQEILERFNLANKCSPKKGRYPNVSLTSRQKQLIITQGEKLVHAGVWSVLVYARVYEALEGSTEE